MDEFTRKEIAMAFKEIAPENLMLNPFTKIGKEWMLITAGADAEHCNTMTASWGAMGVMWGKNVVSVYIPPATLHKGVRRCAGAFHLRIFRRGKST